MIKFLQGFNDSICFLSVLIGKVCLSLACSFFCFFSLVFCLFLDVYPFLLKELVLIVFITKGTR